MSICFFVFAEEQFSLGARLDDLETVIYGQIRGSDSLDSRIARLETIVFGRTFAENSLDSRMERLVKPFSPEGTNDVSLVAKVNFLEWLMQSKVSVMPLLTKVSRLKKSAIGESSLGDPLIF
ncbi:MAG: hypothetical protein PHQ23_10880, partial [Candidatus Wallbacteria bacterium]|nr:hypothetical protein [Candidatus Wallbacteria bacterium]